MSNELFQYNDSVPPAVTACIHYVSVAHSVIKMKQLHEFRFMTADEAISLAMQSFDELKTDDEKFYCEALSAALTSVKFEITQAKVDDREGENFENMNYGEGM